MNDSAIHLYTIGFTEKSAQSFFGLLKSAGVQKLIDTRVNVSSQLAGFAKGKDLAYFCDVVGGISYEHRLDMAPTRDLLAEYRKGDMDWSVYTARYLALLSARNLRTRVQPATLDHACFLCSEHRPEQCHRSLLADYLRETIPNLKITHLY